MTTPAAASSDRAPARHPDSTMPGCAGCSTISTGIWRRTSRVAALADLANLSAFHFTRMFTAAVGTPPYRYVSRRRLENAMAMLAVGKLPLSEDRAPLVLLVPGRLHPCLPPRHRHEPGRIPAPGPLDRPRSTANAVKRTAGAGKTPFDTARHYAPATGAGPQARAVRLIPDLWPAHDSNLEIRRV